MKRAPRPISIVGDIAYVALTRGKIATIDADMVPVVEPYSWSCRPRGYAFRAVRSKGQSRTIYLHRVILGVEGTVTVVDHIDGNPLNNRRANLRLASIAQNQHNRRMDCDNKTGLKGASFNARIGKYSAQIRHEGKKVHLGYFLTAQEANAAYAAAARRFYGNFARSE